MKLDVRGQDCPYPTLKTVEALKRLRPSGETLVVLTDDPSCAESVPAQARRQGYEAEIEENSHTEWTITLTKATKA